MEMTNKNIDNNNYNTDTELTIINQFKVDLPKKHGRINY